MTDQLELATPRCRHCHGTGQVRDGGFRKPCLYCGGTGEQPTPQQPAHEPRRSSQLSDLPPGEWEDIFVCEIDESAGLKNEAA